MPTTFRPPDYEFAAASGDNVNWDPDWSYFDHPPNSTKDLTITSNADDSSPGLFETGETYDLTWNGHGGGNMEDATVIRSDYIAPGQGAIVFEGTNSNTGELFQMVWSPGHDLEAWYWNNGGGPSSPNAFWTSDQDTEEFQYVCYAKGTLIATPSGSLPIEALKMGDLVQTLDNGPKPICWLRQDVQPLNAAERGKKPVLIAANALGNGRPERDTIVSPQHRIFVGGQGQLKDHFKTEAFAPAKALTGLRGIRHMNGIQQIVWCHFALDRHEVIMANECLSESLLVGSMVINGLTAAERRALTDVFGSTSAPDTALNGPPARECLKVGAVRRQLARCSDKHKKQPAHEITKLDANLST
ncbi:MAG: Hint domain-containing protein [Hyphomicrobiales bacterium]